MNRTEKSIVVLSTSDDREVLERIADCLVRERLAACVQIGSSISSYYIWNGNLEKATEFQIVIKTFESKFSTIEQRIKSLHNYDVPQIIAIAVTNISDDYTAWLKESIDG